MNRLRINLELHKAKIAMILAANREPIEFRILSYPEDIDINPVLTSTKGPPKSGNKRKRRHRGQGWTQHV